MNESSRISICESQQTTDMALPPVWNHLTWSMSFVDYPIGVCLIASRIIMEAVFNILSFSWLPNQTLNNHWTNGQILILHILISEFVGANNNRCRHYCKNMSPRSRCQKTFEENCIMPFLYQSTYIIHDPSEIPLNQPNLDLTYNCLPSITR